MEEYKPRSIAAITREERRKRLERRKSEQGRKNKDSDSDFHVSSDEESDEEEVEDLSDDEYSDSEIRERSNRGKSGRKRRSARHAEDQENGFYVDSHAHGGGGENSLSSSLNMGRSNASGDQHGQSSGSKRKYNRFNRRNLSFDDRCQQLLHFKSLYGHCHVREHHPPEHTS